MREWLVTLDDRACQIKYDLAEIIVNWSKVRKGEQLRIAHRVRAAMSMAGAKEHQDAAGEDRIATVHSVMDVARNATWAVLEAEKAAGKIEDFKRTKEV